MNKETNLETQARRSEAGTGEKMHCERYVHKSRNLMVLLVFFIIVLIPSAMSQCKSAGCDEKAEKSNMELVGYSDLQGRNAYMPVIQKQGDRWILYVGHHANRPQQRLNPLTNKVEPNGTSILDVTDPKHPKYLAHIPGQSEGTGAPFLHTCSGNDLPHGEKGKFYMLRAFGAIRWEMWDVTNPAKPSLMNVVLDGLENTHNGWWECETGIAYLGGGPLDWINTPVPGEDRHDAYSHTMIYDLSNPAKAVFIRSFGIPGQQPGSAIPQPLAGQHHILSTGPKGNRVYIGNGDAEDGITLILDREKLLNGPKEPTDENLRYPLIGMIQFPHDMGSHTPIPLPQMPLADFAKQKTGSVKDFLAVIGEGHANRYECGDARQMMRIFDITTPSKPVGVSTWSVSEASGNFCTRGGYFSTHTANENFTPIYYKRIMFISNHNAGVHAVDIRDPYHPTDIAYYIPATTEMSKCVGKPGQPCKKAIDTTTVEVDDRGYIYIVDANDTGMHIVQLTGAARQLADFSQAVH
jgi:hypothetical protein